MAANSGGLPLAEHNGGYPIEIFQPVQGKLLDEKFVCNFCNKILRDPVQSFCGHRFCKSCINPLISREENARCPHCERDDVTDDYSLLQADQMFPDNAIRREMFKLPVKCVNTPCTWTGDFKNFESHYVSCEHQPVTCPSCQQLVRRSHYNEHMEKECPAREVTCKHCKTSMTAAQLEEHTLVCPKERIRCEDCGKRKILREKMAQHKQSECQHQKIQCPLGCGSFDKRALSEHMISSEFPKHFDWLLNEVGSKSASSIDMTTLIPMMKPVEERILAIENKITDISNSNQQIDQKIRQAVEMHSAQNNDRIQVLEVKTGTFEGIANALHRELDKTITAMEKLDQQRRLVKDSVEEQAQKICTLERTLALKDISIAEQDLRIQSLESASYDGTFFWKVADFSKKQQDASQGRSISIYSPAFYTSRRGYKMCARLYPNGDGMGKGSHLSLFFVVMRGTFDALQRWPFQQRVTFCLVNQHGNEHVLDSFRPDPSSSSFKRPTSDMNIASGCPLFMRLDTLTSPANGFIKDDTLFIKITVDKSDLRDPLGNQDDRIKVVSLS